MTDEVLRAKGNWPCLTQRPHHEPLHSGFPSRTIFMTLAQPDAVPL
jgi:hypothetical protein